MTTKIDFSFFNNKMSQVIDFDDVYDVLISKFKALTKKFSDYTEYHTRVKHEDSDDEKDNLIRSLPRNLRKQKQSWMSVCRNSEIFTGIHLALFVLT